MVTGAKKALERTLTVKLIEKTYAFGDAFEHFIILEIPRLSQYLFPDWQTSYLSAPSGVEIDLIIDRPGQSTVVLEIKSTDSVTDRDVKALNRFAPDFPGCMALCFSRDTIRKKWITSCACTGRTACVSWDWMTPMTRAAGKSCKRDPWSPYLSPKLGCFIRCHSLAKPM